LPRHGTGPALRPVGSLGSARGHDVAVYFRKRPCARLTPRSGQGPMLPVRSTSEPFARYARYPPFAPGRVAPGSSAGTRPGSRRRRRRRRRATRREKARGRGRPLIRGRRACVLDPWIEADANQRRGFDGSRQRVPPASFAP
jgi:hypothetical protein